MKTKQILRDMIDLYGLEEVFELLEIEPVDAILELYEIGSVDLERLLEYHNDQEQDD